MNIFIIYIYMQSITGRILTNKTQFFTQLISKFIL